MPHARSRHRQLVVSLVTAGLGLAFLASGCSGGSPADAEGGRWHASGPLLAWDGTLWVAGGEPFVVPSALGMDERRWLGAIVTAAGTSDEHGRRIADEVSVVEGQLPNSSLPAATVSGMVQVVDGVAWQVADRHVVVPDGVAIEGDAAAAAGALATVEGYLLDDGRVLATRVILREGDGATAAPTHTPVAAGRAEDTHQPADTTARDEDARQPDETKHKPDKDDKQPKPAKPRKHGKDDDEGALMDWVLPG